MPGILYKSEPKRGAKWQSYFAQHAPDLEFVVWPHSAELAQVDYLVAWAPPRELLLTLPNLKVLFSIGAGVDHIDFDAVPNNIPVVRMVEPGLIAGMVEYVCWAVLNLHRNMRDYARQQTQSQWHELPLVPAATRTVGVMGLGVLGRAVLDRLATFGYRLRGWSRTPKALPGVACFAGSEGLPEFLAACDVLVCMLPLTDATRGILNARLFAQLPRGAAVVNVGRGAQLDAADLLAALDRGQIAQAILDVTDPEPLPAHHAFWRHPQIVLTPHIASITQPMSAAEVLLANIRRHQRGEPLPNVVDRHRGY